MSMQLKIGKISIIISLYETILTSVGAGASATPIRFSKVYEWNKMSHAKKDLLTVYKNYPGIQPKKISYAFDLLEASSFSGCDFQFALDEFTYRKLAKLDLSYLKKQEGVPLFIKVHVDIEDESPYAYYYYNYKEKDWYDISEELIGRKDVVDEE